MNAREWLDKKYPKEQRESIEELDIRSERLEGYLNLRDFTSLRELDCSYNQLIQLDLTKCSKLEKLDCNDNCLQDLKFPIQSGQLVEVNIRNNNSLNQDVCDYLKDLIESKSLKRIDIFRKTVEQLSVVLIGKSNDSQEEESDEEIDVQKYLKENSNKLKKKLKRNKGKLDLSNLKLIGSLSFLPKESMDFADLVEKLDCSNNRLENLEGLSESFRLFSLDCSRNLLTDLSFLNFPCLENKLTYLDVSENKFFEKGLICFRHFDSLKELKINATDVSRSLGEIYEHLYDHLKECRNIILDKLKEEHSKLAIVERKMSEQKKAGDLFKQWVKKIDKRSIINCEAQISRIINEVDLSKKYVSEWKEEESLIYSSELEIARLMGLAEAQERELSHYRSQPNQQIFINRSNVGNVVTRDINQTTYQQYNVQYQQLETDLKQQASKILTNQEITPRDQKIINQTIIFLGTKELFINYRQAIVNNLIDCYCKLAGKDKTPLVAKFVSVMGITSKIAKTAPGGGVAETPLGIIGDIANLVATIKKESDLKQCIKEFQEILAKDGENLTLLKKGYWSLIQVIWPDNEQGEVTKTIIDTFQLDRTQLRPFANQDVFQAGGGIWEKNLFNLNSEQLKSFVKELNKSLGDFRQEFEKQKNQLAQQEWFKAIEAKTDLLQEQPQTQIQIPSK